MQSTPNTCPLENRISVFSSLGLLFLIVGSIGRAIRFWGTSGEYIFGAGRFPLILGAIFLATGILLRLYQQGKVKLSLDYAILALGLLILAFSDWFGRPYSFFPLHTLRLELLISFIAGFILFRRSIAMPYLVAAGICFLIYTFWTTLSDRLLISDDHATFLFRLKLLKENFPNIPFWHPLWNGGFDARDFFATGALNVFFISLPFIAFLSEPKVYNLIVTWILFVVLPLSTFLGSRIIGLKIPAASTAALLALTSSTLWYKWALIFGTMGFTVSASLLPLVLAYGFRFFRFERDFTFSDLIISLVLVTLMILWSPAGLTLIPFACFGLYYLRSVMKSHKRLILIALVLVINIPWMMMMFKVSKIGAFLDKSKHGAMSYEDEIKPGQKVPEPSLSKKLFVFSKRSVLKLQETLISFNPLLLFLGLPALIASTLPNKKNLQFFCGWLFLLGLAGPIVKPQLELDRMLVVLGILLSIPVADLIVRIIETRDLSFTRRLTVQVILAFLLVSPFSASALIGNKTLQKYYTANQDFWRMNELVKEHSHSGRLLFSGCILHELSGGHLAPITLFTGIPLVASTHVHNIWTYTQIIPKNFLESGEPGIERYFDLMNATVIIAHEPFWRDYFTLRPEKYGLVAQVEKFKLFKRIGYESNYFLNGKGEILKQTNNSVTLRPGTDSVVLKFNYFPFLESSACELSSANVVNELYFVKLDKCPVGKEVVIKSVSPVGRFFAG